MSSGICFRAAQCGRSVLLLGSLLFILAGSGAAVAGSDLPPSARVIRVEIEGTKIGQSVKSIKLGTLVPLSESKPGAATCPEAQRLVLTGTSILADDTSGEIAEWYKKVLAGATDRKSGSVIMMDREGNEVLRTYSLFECYPTAYRKHSNDCDDTDSSLVEIDLAVGAVSIGAGKGKNYGDYLPAHNWKIEIDGIISGGFRSSCLVRTATMTADLSEAFRGVKPATGPSTGGTVLLLKFGVTVHDVDDDSNLCSWILQAQAAPTASSQVLVSPLQMGARAQDDLQRTGSIVQLRMINVRIGSVKLPTLPVSPDGAAVDTHIVEEIEFVVEKVERA